MAKIDICITLYKNYQFIRRQLDLFSQIFTDYNIILCDATPRGEREPIDDLEVEQFQFLKEGLDGEIHGEALDLLVRRATSSIVGICDSDFFWLKPGLLDDIRSGFDRGLKCMGCAGWYDDWQKYLDPRWPERAGHLAPVVWGMFVDRDLAMEQTFVVVPEEAHQTMETGWRLRKKIIEENIPNEVFSGFRYEDQPEEETCYFGTPQEPLGLHFLRGSAWRYRLSHMMGAVVDFGREKWTNR